MGADTLWAEDTGTITITSNGNAFKWSHIAAILSSQNTVIVGTIALGMSQGIMPLVSYNYGKGNAERLKKGVVYVTLIALRARGRNALDRARR